MRDQVIGRGIFSWGGEERRSNRYGSFVLGSETYDSKVGCFDNGIPGIEKFVGKKVVCNITVSEVRKSGHVGDFALGLVPSMPKLMERFTIGGILELTKCTWSSGAYNIILRPEDGRSELWIDPRVFYKLHDQTVSVEVYEAEPDQVFEAPNLGSVEPQAHTSGDGTFQLKKLGEGTTLAPNMRKIDEGTFIIEPYRSTGERVRIIGE